MTESDATPTAPPRATWTTRDVEVPWCPPEWIAALDTIAPGLSRERLADDTESVGQQLLTDGWSLLFGSRRGRLHAHRGDHGEDAGAVATIADGWVAAVADGAGSAPWSRLGSALAVHLIIRSVADALTVPRETHGSPLAAAMRDAAAATQHRLAEFATAVGIAPREMRTTLIVVCCKHREIGVMQVGDGAVALRHRNGTMQHPLAAATGDFSGEVAFFLPDDGALEQLQGSITILPEAEVESVVLATDGVDDPWYPFTRYAGVLIDVLRRGIIDDAVLPPGFSASRRDSVTNAIDPATALLDWLRFEKRGENDDRTLCLIERRGHDG
jgi:hypothetical protein